MPAIWLVPFALSVLAQTPELRVTAADRTGLSITVYQNDLAVVRDSRRVTLPAGRSQVAFADLAASILPTSAYLLDAGKDVRSMERNFEFDLLTPEHLALANLGEAAALRDPATGRLTWGIQASAPWEQGVMYPSASRSARMAGLPGVYAVRPTRNVLLWTSEGYESATSSSLIYRKVPNTLRPSATLLQSLETETAGPRDLQLLYTTGGVSWSAHYIATLDPDAKHFDLDAFATVENRSGTDYTGTSFQLVAGEPNTVLDPDPTEDNGDLYEIEGSMAVVVGPPTFNESRLSEYPIFTLDRPTTLRNGQQKQLALFHAGRIPLRIGVLVDALQMNQPSRLEQVYEEAIEHAMDLDTDLPPEGPVRCEIPLTKASITCLGRALNTAANHLGRALPAGTMDIRYASPEGALLTFGSLDADGTPAGEPITFPLPGLQDAAVRRTIRSLEMVRQRGQAALELEVEVRFINGSRLALPVTFREPLPIGWTVVHSSLPGHRQEASAVAFEGRSKPGAVLALHYWIRSPFHSLQDF